MNCAECGALVGADQQFCRSCGTAVAANTSPPIHPRTVVLISVLLVFVGIIIGVTGGMVDLRWLKFTGVYIMLAGFLSLVAGSPILERIVETRTRWRRLDEAKAIKQRSASSGSSPNLSRADTTNKLLPVPEQDFIPSPPSVTEHSTELLQQPTRKK
ncbi:MAG: hypothetical protein ACJ73D_04305 [Pyrinomonadaceae bacterium]